GQIHAVSGNTFEARRVLDHLIELSKQQSMSPCGIAMIYTALGEKDEAFRSLEKAYELHDGELFNLKVEPKYDPLRSDPRFAELLWRTGLSASAAQQKPTSLDRQTEIGVDRPIGKATLRCIAVLPFKPISTEGRDEYLELGMADALITRLSHLRQIVVRPTSTVRRYTELETDSLAAGRELRVESVIE